MARKRKPQDDQRADLRGKGFVAIPHIIMDSKPWRGLSIRARAVLLEILRRHNGYNNGKLGVSYRDIGAAIGTSSFKAIGNALAELVQSGFIDIEADAQIWQRMAREYRVTWLPTGTPPHKKPATNDWRSFSGDDTVSSGKAVSADTVSSGGKKSADTVSSAIAQNRRKSVKSANGSADTVSSHITKPYPCPEAEREGLRGMALFEAETDPNTAWPDCQHDDDLRRAVKMHIGRMVRSGINQEQATAELAEAAWIGADWFDGFLIGEGMFPQHLARLRVALDSAT